MLNESGLSPVEYNVIIRLDPTSDRTPSGLIILPPQAKEENELAAEEGLLIAASPHAFSYADWPEGEIPPKAGDRVLFARFQGRVIERNGVKYRVIKDKDVIAVVEQPASLAAVA